MKRWSLHIDHPWSECVRDDGCPLRVYMRTPWAWITMALAPGEGSQVYDWKTRTWTERWSWLTFTPIDHRR
jgi:hypothetical protein